MIDGARFAVARSRVLSESTLEGGVGTLSEKTLHKILKFYFEPNEEKHEVSYLGSIADIKNEEGIIEIQTGSFERLGPKLEKFLPEIHVTVVHPIALEKTVFWFDKDTGEISEQKRSPKRGRITDALPELYKIRQQITDENLTVRLVFVSVEEYKALDGYGKYKKIRATKMERIPKRIIEILDLKTKNEYKMLIPEGLPTPFFAKDFDKATALKGRRAYYALKFLVDTGLVMRGEKQGRAYTYRIIEEQENED